MQITLNKNKYAIATVLVFLVGGYLGLSASPWFASKMPTLSFRADSASRSKTVSGKKQGDKIKLNHSDLLTYDVAVRPDVQRLIGNVSFSHGNATMTCDSAYLNESEQVFEAFGNVHMVQADTIKMYGQYLHYDGRTKLARLRKDVKLENKTTTVFTDSLDYDRVADIAYYFEGGTVTDAQNTLTSDYGQFEPKTNNAEFRYNVKLVNDSTEMTTSHLLYNTRTRVGLYDGDTQIKSDSGLIVSKRGTYDLNANVGVLLDRSEVYSGNRMLVGDSIYYDGTVKFGEAFGRMELHDTLQRASLYGDYGYFDGQRNYGFASGRAYGLDYSQKDTLYVGADTLELISFKRDFLADTTNLYPARVQGDSLMRELRAHKHVKVYREDAQAIADSMSYVGVDSVLSLYGKPFLWSDARQMSGDTVIFYFRNKKLDYSDILGKALGIEQMPDNKSYFNQIKADAIRAYMQDSTIRRIEAKGAKVESIFYMKEDKRKQYSGVNRMLSGGMILDLDSGHLKKSYWHGEVAGKMYPIEMAVAQKADKLEEFNWAVERRPQSPEDVVPNDSLVKHYTLVDLRKFSGAKAALDIYTPYDKRQKENRMVADSIRAKIYESVKDYDYPYIRKLRDDAPAAYVYKTNELLDIKRWQYNPFSAQGVPVASTTSTFTGMLDVKRSKEE